MSFIRFHLVASASKRLSLMNSSWDLYNTLIASIPDHFSFDICSFRNRTLGSGVGSHCIQCNRIPSRCHNRYQKRFQNNTPDDVLRDYTAICQNHFRHVMKKQSADSDKPTDAARRRGQRLLLLYCISLKLPREKVFLLTTSVYSRLHNTSGIHQIHNVSLFFQNS